MFSFVIKKTFFDWWDNFIFFFLLNLGYILVLVMLLSISSPYPDSLLVSFLVFFLKVELFFVYTGVIAQVTRTISDYHSVGWDDFFQFFKSSYKTSLFLGAFLFFFFLPFALLSSSYQPTHSLGEMIPSGINFWIMLAILLIFQWFFPLEARLQPTLVQNFKKCLLFFLDNTIFSIGTFIGSGVLFILSIVTGFLLPGIAVVLLWLNVAAKLRLYKYDYLENHPDANRRVIPWEELLHPDREIIGKRTLKGTFFPWKG